MDGPPVYARAGAHSGAQWPTLPPDHLDDLDMRTDPARIAVANRWSTTPHLRGITPPDLGAGTLDHCPDIGGSVDDRG